MKDDEASARDGARDARRKRVLLMVSSMRGGGSERQVLLLAQHLDRARFEPHLYLTEATGAFLKQVPDDVPIHSFDSVADTTRLYVPGRQLRRQTEYVRQVIDTQRIDVVYDRTFHMTLLAGRAAAGVRRVSTIVSPPHQALPLVEKRFVSLKRRRLAAAYRSADAVVAVSHAAARSAESYYGLAADSVIVIPNPIDAPTIHRQSIDKDPLAPVVLVCVGRMTEEKGHADLLQAISIAHTQWPDHRGPLTVRLVGDGPLRSALESASEQLHLGERVTFLGALENAAEEIASADALVLPSRFEGMPNVMLEAMSLGTPVIATTSGGSAELQADQPTAFWAEPANPPALAQAILAFANQPEQASAHQRAAAEYVRAHHDRSTLLHKIEALLT